MTSPAQLTANRANAQHSSGPTSPEGKARVAQNRITHGLAGSAVLLPGEDPQAYTALLARLTLHHLPYTAIEKALVQAIAHNQWRLERIAQWETDLMTEALQGDLSKPSRLMTMFSKPGDPSEALAKLHRYEASIRRAWHSAIKELRLQKSARHRANTVEKSTTALDRQRMLPQASRVRRDQGPPIPAAPAVDDSNPIEPAGQSQPASNLIQEPSL